MTRFHKRPGADSDRLPKFCAQNRFDPFSEAHPDLSEPPKVYVLEKSESHARASLGL
jgi:hypothetical protein